MITTILIIVLLWAIPSAILLVFTCMCSSRFNKSLIPTDNLDIQDGGPLYDGPQHQAHEMPSQPIRPLG